MINKALEMAKSLGFVVGVVVGKEIIKKCAEKVLNKTAQKVGFKSAQEVLETIGKKIFSKSTTLGTKIFSKTGAKTGAIATKAIAKEVSKKVAIKTTQNIAKEALKKLAKSVAAKTVSKIGAAGVKLAGKAGMGPVGWGLMAFDVASMGLDFADMAFDFTGFQNVANNKDIDEMQQMAKETTINELKKQNLDLPINGPLNNFDENKYKDEYLIVYKDLVDKYTSEYLQEISDKLSKINLDDYNLTDPEKEQFTDKYFDENLQPLYDYFDSKDFLSYVDKQMCEKFNGSMINNNCSYKNKESCINGNKKQDGSIDYDNYYEFINGKCLLTPGLAKQICNKHGLEYIYEKQHCKITNEYCTRKSTTFKSDNDGECYDDIGVKIFSIIFGDTITKGVRKIFDTEYTYPRETKGIKVQTFCDDNKVEDNNLCSDKCLPGYNKVSNLNCNVPADSKARERSSRNGITENDFLEDCPPGWEKRGKECIKNCDRPGFRQDPDICVKDVHSYNRARRWRAVKCPDDREEKDGFCSKKCDEGKNPESAHTCKGCRNEPHCAKYWGCEGWRCGIEKWNCTDNWKCEWQYRDPKPRSDFLEPCNGDEETVGAECVKRCDSGYNNTGATCVRGAESFPRERKWRNVNCNKNGDNRVNQGGVCYKVCPDGWETRGVECIRTCSNMGLGNEYRQDPDACIKDAKTQNRNPTVLKSRNYCDDPNFEVFGAACYKKCKPGYEPHGTQCTLINCPDGYTLKDGICVQLE